MLSNSMTVNVEYVAAFLDGEGSVGISYSRPTPIHGQVYRQLKVGFYNNDREVLEEISDSVNEAIGIPRDLYVDRHDAKDNPSGVRNHPTYRIQYNGGKAGRLLEWLRSYLRVKARQADVAIQFQNHKQHIGGRPAPVSRWRMTKQLKAEGKTITEIARLLDVSNPTVHRDLQANEEGVESREDYFVFEKECHEKMMKLNRHPRGCDGTCGRPP